MTVNARNAGTSVKSARAKESGFRRALRVGLVALLAAAPMTVPAGSAVAQQQWAFEQSKEIVNAKTGQARSTSVRVDQTTNLFDREQVRIELDGFLPSRNAEATDNQGQNMEYPVVAMQCRGADPTPETCVNHHRSVWYAGYDAAAPPDLRDRARQLNAPSQAVEPDAIRAENLPFQAVDGTGYYWKYQITGGDPYIDLPAEQSGFPPDFTLENLTTRTVPIRADGGNEFVFEVRQRNSAPSLGCTDTQACSVVLVPIMDLACAEDAPEQGGSWNTCSGEPSGTNAKHFVGPQAWFAASNWQNRYVVPISFAPDLATCDVQDQRPTAPVYGSELIDVAQQRWGSAYCAGLRRADYLPLYTQGSEYEARRQFTNKLGPRYQQNAVVTTQPVRNSPRPVVHAPSALTGFAVAFSIDDGNGREVRELTLSPRLIAKLLTQSYSPFTAGAGIGDGRELYTGSAEQVAAIREADSGDGYYWEHPLAGNPVNIFYDEEFRALNPGLQLVDPNNQFGNLARQFWNQNTPVVFQVQSDIILELTRYLTSDPATRAWLNGRADEQGMVVNPQWRGMEPFELYNLLDRVIRPTAPKAPNWSETNERRYFVRGAGDECDELLQTPWATRIANVTNSAEAAALALLDRRGSATPNCVSERIPVPPEQQQEPQFPGDIPELEVEYSEDEKDAADFGKRAMLSVTTVAHARLYEFPTARLVNASGDAVAPETGTMVNALKAAVQDRATGTIRLEHRRVTGRDAYPGTMVAFTAVPTSGLDRATADNYADFIEFMATDGQIPGDSLTNLPPGYDPLPPNLVRQALDAARAVRAQRGEVPAPPPGGPLGGGTGIPGAFGPGAGGVQDGQTEQARGGEPGAVRPASADPTATADEAQQVAHTEGTESWLSRWMFVILLGVALAAAATAGAVHVGSRPDHPVRRAARSLATSVAKSVARR